MPFKKIQNLVDKAISKGIKRLVVASAHDSDVIAALRRCLEVKLVDPVLIGDKYEIEKIAKAVNFDISHVEVIHEPNTTEACKQAVSLIRHGDADIIMKGLVKTSDFVKPILDKEKGLMKGNLLSHIAFFETPHYHKILALTDAALNITPDLTEKTDIINNAVRTCIDLDIENPKIAVLAAVEVVNEKMEATVHAARLKEMNKQGIIKNCIIDGPLALDNAVSLASAKHKGIVSEVAGDADVLLAPDINSGNVLYKSLGFLGNAAVAAVVTGATVPVVLTSRADSDQNKFYSIALAVALL